MQDASAETAAGPVVAISTTDMAYSTLQVFDAILSAKPGTIFLFFNQKGPQAGFRKMTDDDAEQIWDVMKGDAQTIGQLYRGDPQGTDGC